MANRNILLIEPGYKNKYPPLGLMKIAQYHGPRGRRDYVRFVKGEPEEVLSTAWDRVYITTLFTFEWDRIAKAIDFALRTVNGSSERVFVGGIAASLMHGRFVSESRWSGVRFIKGLLDKSPAESLQLDDFAGELYADDRDGKPIEDLLPDYDILAQIPYRYAVSDAYFAYASRGCIRRCSFCGVPKLEGLQRDAQSLTSVVRGIEKLYGSKKDLILMDNNVVASPRFKDIIAEIRDLGFAAGAKVPRGRSAVLRRVDFNQGVDARILCKDPVFLRQLSSICIRPLRIAFDHLGLRKPYEQSIRYACDAGLKELSNYMLYNFHDSPRDLFERMRMNVALNEELGIRIFSFPMRYQPTDLPNRSHVGRHWNRYYLRSMQVILQATRGIVSGSPDFFRRAFGETYEEFESILTRPHHYIFHREWYEHLGGRPEFEAYQTARNKLSASQVSGLLELLAAYQPSQLEGARRSLKDAAVRNVLRFYIPPTKRAEHRISRLVKQWRKANCLSPHEMPEEERVEDAGLEDNVMQEGSTGALVTRL